MEQLVGSYAIIINQIDMSRANVVCLLNFLYIFVCFVHASIGRMAEEEDPTVLAFRWLSRKYEYDAKYAQWRHGIINKHEVTAVYVDLVFSAMSLLSLEEISYRETADDDVHAPNPRSSPFLIALTDTIRSLIPHYDDEPVPRRLLPLVPRRHLHEAQHPDDDPALDPSLREQH